jgi:hypothetical protein
MKILDDEIADILISYGVQHLSLRLRSMILLVYNFDLLFTQFKITDRDGSSAFDSLTDDFLDKCNAW